MKGRKPLFITLILISTIITPILSLGNPRWSSVAQADNEILWVSEYTTDFQNWDERNAPSPYLADESIGYIHEFKTSGAIEGYFGFEDPSGNGTINSVTLNVECYGDDTNDLIDIWLDCSDGLGWIEEGTINVDQLSYDWEILNFTNRLDSWNDIQNAQIYLTYQGVSGGDDIYVRRAYLSVDYEPESEPEPEPEPMGGSDGNPWWLTNWIYRKSHIITGSTDGDMYNYSFQFKFYYGDGSDGTEVINAINSGKIYLDSKSQTDFEDVRFTTSDGITLLPMWIDIDSVVASTSCVMWTKIDYVPESPANTTIYIYWGNSFASSISDPIETFLFGDDFEDYSIDDPLDSARWDPEGIDASDWILIKANPVGDGQVAQTHETGDNINTRMGTKKDDYFPDGLYRILERWRASSSLESYAHLKGDNDTLALGTWLLTGSSWKWYLQGTGYIDTGDDMFSNTWYVISWWMHNLTDCDNYINNVLADTDTYRNDPTIGLSLHKPLTASRFHAVETYLDYCLIMNFTTNEPTHVYWGSEESPTPTKLFGAGFNASSPYVSLYWTWDYLGYDLFELQNSTDKTSWDYLGQNTTNEYHDFQVVNGTERYYRVRACNYTGAAWVNSSFSDINFETVYFVMPVGDGIGAAARPEGWVLTIMIAAIGVPLIILGTRRRRR